MTWRQVPDPPQADPGSGGWIAWPLATVPLLVAIADPGDPHWWRHWALPIAALLAVLIAVGHRWPKAFLPSCAAALPVLALWLGGPSGAVVAFLAIASIAIWALGLGAVVEPVSRLEPRAVLRPAVVAATVGAVAYVVAPGLKFGAAATVLAVALALAAAVLPTSARRIADALEPRAVTVRRGAGAIDLVIRRGAHVVGRVVASLAMIPVAVGVIAVWVIHRIARFDPLRAPTDDSTDWADRLGSDPHPTRNYAGIALADHRPTRIRATAIAVKVLALLLVAGTTVAIYSRRDDTESSTTSPTTVPTKRTDAAGGTDCSDAPPEPSLPDQPKSGVLACEQSAAFSRGDYLASTGYKLHDFAGETVNERDGVRRTWRPPACRCRRLKVWWFGGSAAWGEGQRDLYTLPSMLARAAWAQGYALDIENFAMPTYTVNQEVHRFAELTATEPAPDLILSYGGGNDLVFQALRASRGHADDASDIALLEQTYGDVVRHGIPVDPDKITWTPNPQEVDATLSSGLIDQVVEATRTRYANNVDLGERLAASIDRPIGFIWQPLLAGSGPKAGPAGAVPPGLLAGFATIERDVQAQLPPQVINLGMAFEDTTQPVFIDLFHTGEPGAALLADQLLKDVKPLLDQARQEAAARPPR